MIFKDTARRLRDAEQNRRREELQRRIEETRMKLQNVRMINCSEKCTPDTDFYPAHEMFPSVSQHQAQLSTFSPLVTTFVTQRPLDE